MPIDRVRSCKGLRIAALLAGTSLGAVDAYAVDGTWQGPGSEWTTGSNWSSGTVPDGVARFTTVGTTSISIPLSTATPPVAPNINTIFFDAPASAYTITNNSTLNILGTGIVNTSTNTQTITNNFLITFHNSSTAGSATIINQTPPGGVRRPNLVYGQQHRWPSALHPCSRFRCLRRHIGAQLGRHDRRLDRGGRQFPSWVKKSHGRL